MASDVEICNMALQAAGSGKRIVSVFPPDASDSARSLNAVYAMIRDSELRAHSWNFAIKRAQLAASVTAPAFGPANAFPLPSDFLRILLPNDNALDWIIEDSSILTDYSAPLEIRYVARIEDPALFDSAFTKAFAYRLALQIVKALSDSTSLKESVREDYRDAIREARRNNAFDSVAQELPEDDWLAARR